MGEVPQQLCAVCRVHWFASIELRLLRLQLFAAQPAVTLMAVAATSRRNRKRIGRNWTRFKRHCPIEFERRWFALGRRAEEPHLAVDRFTGGRRDVYERWSGYMQCQPSCSLVIASNSFPRHSTQSTCTQLSMRRRATGQKKNKGGLLKTQSFKPPSLVTLANQREFKCVSTDLCCGYT